jgi:hypothetical protein
MKLLVFIIITSHTHTHTQKGEKYKNGKIKRYHDLNYGSMKCWFGKNNNNNN